MDWLNILSRMQFAFTIMFHYIFPPLTIGMGLVLVYLEAQYLRTDKKIYHRAAKFWTGIFALNFAIGVATGIVMEFQFGTNWAIYSRFVGDVFGSALAAEGIFAFFLESGFLAVLVFGWDKVSKGMHFFATVMVALGSIFSSIWIVVANSWQQTPAGHEIRNHVNAAGQMMSRAEIVDFWAMVFNPSTVHRLVHVWIGAFILGSFFIMSISAYYMLRRRHEEFARYSFRGALLFATISSIAILFSGHLQAKNVYEHQPAKLAAFEGHYTTGTGDLTLIGWPNDAESKVDYAVAIPGGLSFLVHENFTEPVVGLDRFKMEDRPPMLIPFITWRLMVGFGMFFIAITLFACLMLRGDRIFRMRWLLMIFVIAVIPAMIANQAGWIAAEVGRQPWVVHPPVPWNADHSDLLTHVAGTVDYDESLGLRTAGAISPAVSLEQVIGSLAMFVLIYGTLAFVWLFILNRKIHKGPELESTDEQEHDDTRGFFDSAAELAGHSGSMTGYRDDDSPKPAADPPNNP